MYHQTLIASENKPWSWEVRGTGARIISYGRLSYCRLWTSGYYVIHYQTFSYVKHWDLVFRVVTSCTHVGCYLHFEGTHCRLHWRGRWYAPPKRWKSITWHPNTYLRDCLVRRIVSFVVIFLNFCFILLVLYLSRVEADFTLRGQKSVSVRFVVDDVGASFRQGCSVSSPPVICAPLLLSHLSPPWPTSTLLYPQHKVKGFVCDWSQGTGIFFFNFCSERSTLCLCLGSGGLSALKKLISLLYCYTNVSESTFLSSWLVNLFLARMKWKYHHCWLDMGFQLPWPLCLVLAIKIRHFAFTVECRSVGVSSIFLDIDVSSVAASRWLCCGGCCWWLRNRMLENVPVESRPDLSSPATISIILFARVTFSSPPPNPVFVIIHYFRVFALEGSFLMFNFPFEFRYSCICFR